MEKSGLKGNDTRDFNLLQEIIHYASAELDSEAALEQRLRMHLGMPDEPKNAADKRTANATKVATLLLLNALMLHSRIERAGGRIATELGRKLEHIGVGDDPLSALINSWTTILDHDYKPVFQPARRVATVIRDSEYRTAGWRAVRRLIEWANENTDYYQQMGMEYAGQLFSRVMGHQAADGAYFTRPEAARLLAELALDEMPVKRFSQPGEWLKLKATDLACGSGTLLNAWIESVKDRIRAEGGDEKQCAAWHKKAVEQLTTGLDINPVSLQMAAGRFILGTCPWITEESPSTNSPTGEQATAKSDWERSNSSATMKSWDQHRTRSSGRTTMSLIRIPRQLSRTRKWCSRTPPSATELSGTKTSTTRQSTRCNNGRSTFATACSLATKPQDD